MVKSKFTFNKGLTLLEVMITLALLLVVFGVVSELLRNVFRVLQAQSYKNQATQAVQLALNRMCCEVREASAIDSSPGTTLTLEITDPNYLSGSAPKDPYDPQNLFVVTYERNANNVLQRSIVAKSGGSTITQDLCDGIVGFQCAFNTTTPSTMNITLSVSSLNNGVQPMSCEAFPMAVVP